jgi:hypothetical protein
MFFCVCGCFFFLGSQKLGLQDKVNNIVLEEDGTVVEEDCTLLELQGKTLIFLQSGQCWVPPSLGPSLEFGDLILQVKDDPASASTSLDSLKQIEPPSRTPLTTPSASSSADASGMFIFFSILIIPVQCCCWT